VAGGGGGDDDNAAAFPDGLAMTLRDSGGEVSASVEETNRCVHTTNVAPRAAHRDTTHAAQLGCACLLSPTLATCASPCLVALDASTRVFGYNAPVSLTLRPLSAPFTQHPRSSRTETTQRRAATSTSTAR
jgi:hypothetical protein